MMKYIMIIVNTAVFIFGMYPRLLPAQYLNPGDENNIQHIVFDQCYSSIVYGIYESRLCKSKNSGLDWYDISPADMPDDGHLQLLISKVSPERIYLLNSAKGLIYTSHDCGEHWTLIFESDCYLPLYIKPDEPEFILVTHSGFLYKSETGGDSFHKFRNHNSFSRILINPYFPEYLFAIKQKRNGSIVYGRDYYLSDNSGQSWSESHPGIPLDGYICYDPATGPVMYHVNKTIHKSADGGFTWFEITNGLPFEFFNKLSNPIKLCIDPNNSKNMYAIVDIKNEAGALYKSTNRGEKWQEISKLNNPGSVRSIAISPHDPSVLVLSTSGGMYYSFDSGKTWNDKNTARAEFAPDHD